MVALELASVSKRYGRRLALRDVDLALPSGAAVALLGPNGAGKTTLLHLLLGFLRPTLGAARLQGLDPFDPAARVGVGHLPERLRLPGRMRVEAFLRLQGALAGLAGGPLLEEVARRLDQCGLAERAGDPMGALSKGLAQRVGFAQAFLGDPRILILDEPTAGLDPIGIREARGWLEAARARGATLLVSSHILSEVERQCDHVVILHEGAVAASGRIDEVVRAGESLEDAFVRTVRG
jgi:ABC-2 type transport system ATP-binding protein